MDDVAKTLASKFKLSDRAAHGLSRHTQPESERVHLQLKLRLDKKVITEIHNMAKQRGQTLSEFVEDIVHTIGRD